MPLGHSEFVETYGQAILSGNAAVFIGAGLSRAASYPEWGELLAPMQARADPVGLGRNCTLFESARVWAYREIRNHWGDPAGLGRAIEAEAAARNAEFSEPLPVSEVRAIAASIHRWIVTKSRMWADGAAVYRRRSPRSKAPARGVLDQEHADTIT